MAEDGNGRETQEEQNRRLLQQKPIAYTTVQVDYILTQLCAEPPNGCGYHKNNTLQWVVDEVYHQFEHRRRVPTPDEIIQQYVVLMEGHPKK